MRNMELRHNLIGLILLSMLAACTTMAEQAPLPKSSPDVFIAPSVKDSLENCHEQECGSVLPAQNDSRESRPIVQVSPQQVVKYPPLIFGAPKPLVCSREYLAEGKLQNRPNLQLMWEHDLYERPERVWAEVGGAVEYNGCLPKDKGGWRNACTVRLSHMLNKAGHKIPDIKNQTVSGGSGDQYLYRLDDAQAYLTATFGEPDIKMDMPRHLFDLPSDPGLFIIKFRGADFTGHTTIWNGAGTVDEVDIAGYEIFFWELPCFIPSARKANRNDEKLSAVKIQKIPLTYPPPS